MTLRPLFIRSSLTQLTIEPGLLNFEICIKFKKSRIDPRTWGAAVRVGGNKRMNTSQEDRERIDALSDLRRFVEITEARGELKRIENADPHLEMGGLYELSLRDRYPPALMFERIQGCNADRRVLTNVRFSRIFVGPLDLDAVIRHRAAGKWEEKSIPPEEVETGPVFQNIITGDAVNIYDFPAVKWHDQDGGPYIGTECLVINKDPESDWVNLGTYRTQMHAPRKLTVFMEPGKHGALISEKYWSKGLPCPMAVSVGQAPILGVVAGTSSRSGISEYATAGGRIGQPIKVVRGKLTGLPIPADAELVFEGFMSPPTHETLPEGPFKFGKGRRNAQRLCYRIPHDESAASRLMLGSESWPHR